MSIINSQNKNISDALIELEYAYKNVPFYQNHFDNAGISIKNIREYSDFIKIPPTTKVHYRKNFPCGILVNGITLNDRRLYQWNSSGTTTDRLITVEYGHLFLERAVKGLKVNPDFIEPFIDDPRKHCIYAAPNCSDVECSNPNSSMKSRILKDGSLVLSVYHDLLTTPGKIIDQNVQEIEQYKPQLFYADPTHLAFLIRKMKERGGMLPEVPVILSYTMSNQLNRKQIVDSFKNKDLVAESIAMSEFGFIAFECCNNKIHLNDESFYFELIPIKNAPIYNNLYELYVTSLFKGAMPHIRYRTGDIYSLPNENCICGNKSLVVNIEGRISNMIFDGDHIVLTPRMLDNIIGAPEWLDLYNLHQHEERQYTFSFVSNNNYSSGNENEIIKHIIQHLGKNIKINVENVGYIPTKRGGKYQFCTSRVAERKVSDGFSL